MNKNDPYHDNKICHRAGKMDNNGRVSALCFDPPRAINTKVAKYVIAPENNDAITCKKCQKILGI